MSDTVHLPAPATVTVVRDDGTRVDVSFDAGDVTPSSDDERAALDTLTRIAARRRIPATVADVKEWVGDNPARAAQALQAEQNRDGGPRTTLVSWLEGLADSDDDTASSNDTDDVQEGTE